MSQQHRIGELPTVLLQDVHDALDAVEDQVNRLGDEERLCRTDLASLIDQMRRSLVQVTVAQQANGDTPSLRRAETFQGGLKPADTWPGDLLRACREAMVAIDEDGQIAFFNPAAERLFQRSAADILGRTMEAILPEEQWDECKQRVLGYLADGDPCDLIDRPIEIRLPADDGQTLPIELSLSAGTHHDGRFVLAIIRDITERTLAEEAARRAHAEDEQLIASIRSIMICVDGDFRITRWNSGAEETFGIPAADVLGTQFSECPIEWDSAELMKAVAQCLLQGEPRRVDEMSFKRPDGRHGDLGLTLNPIKGNGASRSGFLLKGKEITGYKAVEAQMAQAQKLEAIGQLAAGIAHEINTPTQFVGDNLRFLQDAFGDITTLLDKCRNLTQGDDATASTSDLLTQIEGMTAEADVEYLVSEIPKAIDQSLEGVQRVAKIVLAMKDFSHPGGDEKQAVDLNKAIESTITVARNEWKYVADVVTDLDPSLPPVPCFPSSLNQVVLNLLINASHAIADLVGEDVEEKGTITVSTRTDGDFVETRVADTGAGIPETVQAKVFDPFFTTKEVGKGTGQGLAMAHSVIVEKHQGSIAFETKSGKGTTFIIRLPLHSASGDAPEEGRDDGEAAVS